MNDQDVVQALYLGARGIVLKDMASRLIGQCIRTVHAGGRWVEKGVATVAVEKLLKREAGVRTIGESLTPRELEVARMIAAGLPSKAVASQLDISEGTAKLHLHHVYEKLKLSGRVALVHYMQSHGLD
jgi:DNA-binding NarL/FixJ family response regulator